MRHFPLFFRALIQFGTLIYHDLRFNVILSVAKSEIVKIRNYYDTKIIAMSQQRLDDRRSSRPAAVRHQDTKFEIELVVKFIGNKCWTTVSKEKKSREPT